MMFVNRRVVVAVGCGLMLVSVASQARSETLADAIALAYQANPTLQSQRAQLRALDETYVQARAGWRPTLSATAVVDHTKAPQAGIFGGASEVANDTGQFAITAAQPLYTGGRVEAQVGEAEAQIRSGREQLRITEATVLFSVVQAYMDVIRDRASLTIQRVSLQNLQNICDEIKARQEAGATTSTDVVQAQAQLEAAHALVISAEAQVDISVAEYVAAVGQSPGELAPPPPMADVPTDLDKAFDVAEAESPSIRGAQYTEAADRESIRAARAAARPTVAFNGSVGENSLQAPFDHHQYDHAVSVSLNVQQPIFTGGTVESQIRQAIESETSARLQVDVARRAVIQTVSQVWSQRRAAQLNIGVNAAEVKVAQAAYDGMREEYRAGLRETLDVLIAEQTLSNAQIALAQAQHDAYVAEAELMQAIGRLEARVIIQGRPLYQPQAAFRQVENAGALPWEFVPRALDKIGEPGLNQPRPIERLDIPASGVMMTSPIEGDGVSAANSTAEKSRETP